ncbi:MAG: ABA4-like family protein [Hansschlegelia sp.]
MIPAPALFAACNAIALVAWLALGVALFAPAARRWTWRIAGLALPALFAVAYVGALTTGLAAGGEGGFGSIPAVRALFANDHALTAGWIHYLAFDLIVGALISRDGVAAGLSPFLILPSLALTFLFGPAGLLLHLVIRTARGGRLPEALS